MLCGCPCDHLLLSSHRAHLLCRGERVEKALPEVIRQWEGWPRVRQVLPLGYFKAGFPEMALAKLPPKYIVSRMSQWAVADRQAGRTAKKKIKIITTLIDRLHSRGD